MAQRISSLPAPVFVNDADGTDPNLILADMIASFESSSGRTLQPAQVERLLIDLLPIESLWCATRCNTPGSRICSRSPSFR